MSRLGNFLLACVVEIFFVALALGGLGVALGLLYRLWGGFFPTPSRKTVLAFQQGVVVLENKVERLVGQGSHWITPKRTLIVCDVRPVPFQVANQQVQAADGMQLRVSLGGEYLITDAAKFVAQNSSSFDALYLELRQALRTAAREFEGHSIMNDQSALIIRVKELTIPRADQLGLELTQIEMWEATPLGWFTEAARNEESSS
jgi:regulator of protease activity HflC (stomatin/prohibitin superfamily)